jgi:hypothetical protein
MNIPDNHDVFMAHEQEKERWLAGRPVCSYCEQHIQEEFFYEIDCEKVCEDCLKLHFRRTVQEEY